MYVCYTDSLYKNAGFGLRSFILFLQLQVLSIHMITLLMPKFFLTCLWYVSIIAMTL